MILRSGLSMKEITDEDIGLTVSQLKVLDEELLYQDQSQTGRQLDALTHQISALASIMGAMMGGDASGISDSMKAMQEAAQAYQMITSGITQTHGKLTKEDRQMLEEHPLFINFRLNAGDLVQSSY